MLKLRPRFLYPLCDCVCVYLCVCFRDSVPCRCRSEYGLCQYRMQHMSVIQMVARVCGRGVLPSEENNGTGDKICKNQSLETLSDLNFFTHTTQLSCTK